MANDWKDILSGLAVSQDLGPESVDSESVAVKGEDEAGNKDKGKKIVTLFYEKKGRGGKQATILADFVGVTAHEIDELATDLKRKLGTGGSVRNGEILIQGDRRTDLRRLLSNLGYKVKG